MLVTVLQNLPGNPGEKIYGIILIFICCIVNVTPVIAQTDPDTVPVPQSLTGLEPLPLTYTLDTSNATVEYDRNGETRPIVTGINIQQYADKFKSQTIETFIEPQQQIEYMINMEQGDVLLYTWEINGRIYFDLHGHQEDVDPEIWIRYVDGRTNSNHGSFTAPFTGEHGWFWANMDSKPVKLTLTITGYYKNIFRIDL